MSNTHGERVFKNTGKCGGTHKETRMSSIRGIVGIHVFAALIALILLIVRISLLLHFWPFISSICLSSVPQFYACIKCNTKLLKHPYKGLWKSSLNINNISPYLSSLWTFSGHRDKLAHEPQISGPIEKVEKHTFRFLWFINMLRVDRQFWLSCAGYLDLLLVEHAQPLQVDHVGQALSEGQAVRPDLLVQSVVSHQMDVGYPVCCNHRNVFPSRFQLHHLGQKGMRHIQVFHSFNFSMLCKS